jgi:hypothetical protein
MSRLALLLALALGPARLAAQAHPLVGEWTVTLAVGMRMENDVETPIMQTGTMSIVAQGDSLIATTKMQPPEGRPARPPSRMAAKAVAGAVTFVLTSQATINMNGEMSTRTATSTFVLTANADAMTGTLARTVEGMDMPATPLPVTGTRVKG